MNLLQFLAIKLHQGAVFIDGCSLAVRQRILQDHYVTYREIGTTLGINETSIH